MKFCQPIPDDFIELIGGLSQRMDQWAAFADAYDEIVKVLCSDEESAKAFMESPKVFQDAYWRAHRCRCDIGQVVEKPEDPTLRLVRNDVRESYPYVGDDDYVYWTIEEDYRVLWTSDEYNHLDLIDREADVMDSFFARVEVAKACRRFGLEVPGFKSVTRWGNYQGWDFE